VISQLGGKREELTCPWCDGGGTRIPEHDAQARFKPDPTVWDNKAQEPPAAGEVPGADEPPPAA
jgi:hypothetical protein